jgi:hypothetical protein
LQRTQLIRVSKDLQAIAVAVRNEAAVSRRAWPLISDGLPGKPDQALLDAVGRASSSAGALPTPAFTIESGKLTGPAAGIAGLYESFDRLSERGWRLTETSLAAIGGGSTRDAAFARGNSALYIDAVYDAHFNLSLLGKSIAKGYERLGGPSAFGAALPPSEIDALTKTYSIATVRLEPHPGPATEEH